MKRNFLLLLLALTLIGALAVWHQFYRVEPEPLHIALALPLSGETGAMGRAARDGIQLQLEKMNSRIHGRKLVLDLYDDKNDPTLAQEIARDIATQGRALAVIGHYNDQTTESAAPIYQEHGVPVITPSARGDYAIFDNPWYFRTINRQASQAKFILHYFKEVLEVSQITLITDTSSAQAPLAEVLNEAAIDAGIELIATAEIDGNSEYLEYEVEDLLETLPPPEDAGALFIAAGARSSVPIVRMLRDNDYRNVIAGPDSFASEAFREGFNGFPIEAIYPGYYTNQVIAFADVIYDSANKQAQQFKESYIASYGYEPEPIAAFAHDAALMILDALRTMDPGPSSIQEQRAWVRDHLAAINSPARAIPGATGYNYFDADGEVLKDITVGVYKSKRLISLFTQLRSIRYLNEISNIEQELANRTIVAIDQRFFYRTKIVKTGIQINRIAQVDSKDLSAEIDFDIWFRYQGDIDVSAVTFHNSISPVELGEPAIENLNGPTNYVLYKVKHRFKLDDLVTHFGFNRHVASISFHHRDLTLNNLLYVTDVVGMSVDKGVTLREQMEKRRVIPREEGWRLGKVWFYTDLAEEYPLGRPEFLALMKGVLEHSSFNMATMVIREGINFRGSFPGDYAHWALMVAFALVLFLFYLWRNQKGSGLVLVAYALSLMSVLWLLEITLVTYLSGHFDIYFIRMIILGFDVWWWFMPAYLVVELVDRFGWQNLERGAGHPIPQSVKFMTSFVIYTFAAFGIVAFVFDQRLTSLLATSGLFMMIIGLAVQMNISNIFAGIAVNVERPYRIGDWIEIDGKVEGQVIDINWRTTRIKERKQNILSVPNTLASESVVRNFNYPSDLYRTTQHIFVNPGHDPRWVMSIIVEGILASGCTLEKPLPFARYKGSNGWSDEYMVAYHSDNYQKKLEIDSEVMCTLWQTLTEHGIQPALHSSVIRLLQGETAQSSLPALGKIPG